MNVPNQVEKGIHIDDHGVLLQATCLSTDDVQLFG